MAARLQVAATTERLFELLVEGLPDVLLLPALFSPSQEAHVFEFLRRADGTRPLQVLVTPYSLRRPDDPTDEPRGWRRLLSVRRASPPSAAAGEQEGFAERILWAVGCARDARLARSVPFDGEGVPSDVDADRRVHRRYSPSELDWLKSVRVKDGAPVTLLDLSAGGALIEAGTELRAGSDGLLELRGLNREWQLPFHVARSKPFGHGGGRYVTACVFAAPFAFDRFDGPFPAGLPVQADSMLQQGVLASFARSGERHERDPRLVSGDVPWISSVSMPQALEVDLLNISRSGMLVEMPAKISPGEATEVRLQGDGTTLSVPARVVRSEVAAADHTGVKYHAAVRFDRSLELPLPSGRIGDAAPQPLAELLAAVLRDIGPGNNGTRREQFVAGLRRLVRARDISIVTAPVKSDEDAESIYFTVPRSAGPRAVLQATFERDHAPTDAEFRLLQTAAASAAAVLELERL